MKNKKGLLYFVLFLSVLGGVFYYALPRMTVNILTRASRVGDVSSNMSYVIGEKLLCKADGLDKCIVDVFIADDEGLPVLGKKISLKGIDNVKAIVDVTDKLGKASFELVSSVEGQYQIFAVVEGKTLSRSVTITFRN